MLTFNVRYSPYSLGPYRSVSLATSQDYVKISESIDFYTLITILAVGTSENLQLFHNSRLNCAPSAPLKFDTRHVEFLANGWLCTLNIHV